MITSYLLEIPEIVATLHCSSGCQSTLHYIELIQLYVLYKVEKLYRGKHITENYYNFQMTT